MFPGTIFTSYRALVNFFLYLIVFYFPCGVWYNADLWLNPHYIELNYGCMCPFFFFIFFYNYLCLSRSRCTSGPAPRNSLLLLGGLWLPSDIAIHRHFNSILIKWHLYVMLFAIQWCIVLRGSHFEDSEYSFVLLLVHNMSFI